MLSQLLEMSEDTQNTPAVGLPGGPSENTESQLTRFLFQIQLYVYVVVTVTYTQASTILICACQRGVSVIKCLPKCVKFLKFKEDRIIILCKSDQCA